MAELSQNVIQDFRNAFMNDIYISTNLQPDSALNEPKKDLVSKALEAWASNPAMTLDQFKQDQHISSLPAAEQIIATRLYSTFDLFYQHSFVADAYGKHAAGQLILDAFKHDPAFQDNAQFSNAEKDHVAGTNTFLRNVAQDVMTAAEDRTDFTSGVSTGALVKAAYDSLYNPASAPDMSQYGVNDQKIIQSIEDVFKNYGSIRADAGTFRTLYGDQYTRQMLGGNVVNGHYNLAAQPDSYFTASDSHTRADHTGFGPSNIHRGSNHHHRHALANSRALGPVLGDIGKEGDIYFKSGSASLDDGKNNREAIMQMAHKIKDSGVDSVTIIGHADKTGSAEAKQRISDTRAKVVGDELQKALVSLGITNIRIDTQGVSDHNLIAGGNAHNRYTAILLTPPPPPPPAAASPPVSASAATPPDQTASSPAATPQHKTPLFVRGVEDLLKSPFEIGGGFVSGALGLVGGALGFLRGGPRPTFVLNDETKATLRNIADLAKTQGLDSVVIPFPNDKSVDPKVRAAQEKAIREEMRRYGVDVAGFDKRDQDTDATLLGKVKIVGTLNDVKAAHADTAAGASQTPSAIPPAPPTGQPLIGLTGQSPTGQLPAANASAAAAAPSRALTPAAP